MTQTLSRVKRPCDECPWRVDAEPGRFTQERWEALMDSDATEAPQAMGAPLFACHKTPAGEERACAGWLAQVGHRHLAVRLAVISGDVPGEALAPKPDWPPLHESVREAAEHDGAWV